MMACLLSLHPIPANVDRACDECPRIATFYDAANDHYLCKRHTIVELGQLSKLVEDYQRA